ncbi:hypothetical protein FVEN_g6907 [Fusarium venenatum]|uniref:Uncharacterized protein n=1 Tax=Fusarium venenatum TaxID=56646 RepID=A0A2L2TXH1_9HYPO|nr:uncharacterized protein FVRRES_09453 [Fusarium venenatum]KAG8355141.1 hypothetical protein FVEN_g6907 [Fusarium venenatum]CEI69376.1 unnamed protein product [Fusarium venenatum]
MTSDMDDSDSCGIKKELIESQTSSHTRSVGVDTMSQDLVNNQVTVDRLYEKYRDLEESMETHILSLRGEIKSLKFEHSYCASNAKIVNDLKEQINRLSVQGATNETFMENYKLRIMVSELQDKGRDQEEEISKLTRGNQDLQQVMDQQRKEMDDLEGELDDTRDENFGLTHVQDDMAYRLRDILKENDRLEKDLVEERRKSQPFQNTHPSESQMYKSELATLKRLLTEKESKLAFLEAIVGDELQDWAG